MKDPATGGTEPFDHPEAEELAAFIDGFLSEDRCARIRRHLGRCEDCYEIFMEAVRFKEEEEEEQEDEPEDEQPAEGNVRPFPIERSPSTLRWAAAAAAVVAAIVLGPTVYHALQTSGEDRVEALVAALPSDAKPLYPEVGRGPGPELEAASESSFQCGVELINLSLSLKTGEVKEAGLVAGRLLELLRQFGGVDVALTNFYQAIQQGKTPLTPALAQDAVRKADQFRTQVPGLDPTYLGLGQWTEAGYIAASSGQGDYFARREIRDYPRRIRKQERVQLETDGVDQHLARIEELIAHPDLSAEDFEGLRSAFRGILLVYYNTS